MDSKVHYIVPYVNGLDVSKAGRISGVVRASFVQRSRQVESRLRRSADEDHFGSIRALGDGLWELKFNNGTRVYYARTGEAELTLILGGNKHGQKKDIKKAKKFING